MSFLEWIIFLLLISATVLLFISIDNNYGYVKKRIRQISKYNYRLSQSFKTNDLNIVMKNAGIPFNLYHYQLFRISILIVFGLSIAIDFWISKELNKSNVFIMILIIILTQPREKILRYRSPFQMMIDLFTENIREKYNDELYLAISQMKNNFMIKKEHAPSGQLILEEVRQYAVKLKPVFNRFLNYWTAGDKDFAIEYFVKAVGTKEARNLSQIFYKLDELNPSEMRNQLEDYQNLYRAERETKKKKKNEFKSLILFSLIIVTAFVILLNFLVVGFYIDQIKEINKIF